MCNEISDVPDPQYRIRPEPDLFFKLGSGQNWIRIVFSNKFPAGYRTGSVFQIRFRLDLKPDIFSKSGSGSKLFKIVKPNLL